jgi:hypothetical protein
MRTYGHCTCIYMVYAGCTAKTKLNFLSRPTRVSCYCSSLEATPKNYDYVEDDVEQKRRKSTNETMLLVPSSIRSTTQFASIVIAILLTITTLNPTTNSFRISQLNLKNQQVLFNKLYVASSSSDKTNRPSLFKTQRKPLLAGLGDLFCSITGIPPKSL